MKGVFVSKLLLHWVSLLLATPEDERGKQKPKNQTKRVEVVGVGEMSGVESAGPVPL
jgi:hypothetical protein